jgi:hypothetical protein
MTLPSIILKNIKFNFKKYMAYFVANSFIITALLMYGSLMFSSEFANAPEASSVKGNFYSIIAMMIIFSIVFISYTTVTFIRYRGKEFGLYLTLGVTTKDLTKILIVENILILSASYLAGVITGTIFSRIFYMIIGKILWLDNLKPALSFKTYGLCLAITFSIFIINSIFQMIHIRRLSIIKLIKSSSTREIGNGRLILGTISVVAFTVALILFPSVIRQELFVGSKLALDLILITIIATPYFIIGSLLAIINKFIKIFKGCYNKRILVLTSLQHRFLSYKSILYLVTILASAAIVFIAMSYSMYTSTEHDIKAANPYDINFIENSKYNKISMKEIESVITEAGGKVIENKTLEVLNLRDYRVYDGMVMLYGDNLAYISSSNYNKHMGTNISVKKGEVVQVLEKNNNGKFKDSDMIVCLLDPEDERAQIDKSNEAMMFGADVDKKTFLSNLKKDCYMYVDKTQKSYIEGVFTNDIDVLEYYRGTAFILNDADYNRIKAMRGTSSITYEHLITLKNHSDQKSFNAIYHRLKELNKNQDNLGAEFTYEKLKNDIRDNGFMLFSNAFMGLIFLIASGVVLYFKVLTGISEDRERAEKLKQLSMTSDEIAKVFSKELGIIFLVPVVLATGIVTFFMANAFKLLQNGDYMFKQSLYVFAAYLISQTAFFFITRGKYIKETVSN